MPIEEVTPGRQSKISDHSSSNMFTCEIIEASPKVKDLGKRATRALVNGCRQITAQYTAYVAALESGGRRKSVRAAEAKCGKERLEEEKPVSKVVQEERSRPREVTQRLR